jgi:hypothetical protein
LTTPNQLKTYGTIKSYSGSWVIECDPHVLLRMRRVFPRMSRPRYQEGKLREVVCLMDTPEICRELEWFQSRFPFDYLVKADEHRLAKRAGEHREEEFVVHQITGDKERKPQDFKLALPPRDYQKVAAELALRTRGVLIGDEMGLGKTVEYACVLTDARTRPALVVTKTALTTQWQSELRKFLPRLTVHILKGTRPYDVAKQCGGALPDVIVTSYSKLPGWGDYLSGHQKLAGAEIVKLNSVGWDEVQEFRNGEETQKGAAGMKIAKRVQYRVGLSGTPFINMGGELWSVMEFIRPGALGLLREFKQEHCVGDTDKPGKLKLKAPEAMGAHLRDAGLMIRRTKKDVDRQLPPLTRIPHYIDFDQKVLDAVDGQATALARTILAKTETSRGARMQAAGTLDSLLRQATGVAKAPHAADFVRMLVESGESVLCFAWHHKVYDVLREKLAEFAPAFYTGEETLKEKLEAKRRFVEGETKILVMSLRAGEGLDGLQHVCSNVVYAELDFSPGIHEQCLSADTEILTPDGFKGVDDLQVGNIVAGFDLETGEVRWTEATNKTDRSLAPSERMFSMKTKKVDIRVTGDHRMVVRRKQLLSKKVARSKWEITTAKDLAGRSSRFVPISGMQSAKGVPLTDYELRFLGWFVTDGSFNGKTVTIYQEPTQPWNADIREVLDGCGFNWSFYQRTNAATGRHMNMYTVAKGSRRFISAEEIEIAQAMRATGTAPSEIASQLNLAATTIYRTLKRSAGDVATKTGGYHGRRGWLGLEQYLDKDLSPLLENMTREQLRVFLHAVNMGDGAKNKQHFKTTMRITSTNHLFASRLQSICVRRGFSAYLSIRKTRTKADKLVYDVYIRDGAEAVIHHRGKKNSFSQCEAIEGERVWCVTNELGTLVTRRNGKVCVLGNCDARIYRDGQPLPVFSYFLLAEEGSDPIISDILGVKRAQLEGVRDMKVGGDLPQEIDVDRIRKLAQSYLDKKSIRRSA